MAGFGLAHFVLVGHTFGHPVHWFYSFVGGLVGYVAGLLWTYRPSGMRLATGRWLWLYRGSAGLLVAAFIMVFILIGYVFPGGQPGAAPTDSWSQGPPPGPGERVALMGDTAHLPDGITYGAYSSIPPTSGPHYATPAAWGAYSSEIPDERVVHNIEHSAVIVSYNLEDPAQVAQLKETMEKQPGYPCYIILRPYSNIPAGMVALSAWGVQQVLTGVDETAIGKFVRAYAGRAGPETLPCTA